MIAVEMVADIICTWCFLGKRRLDKPLVLIPDIDVKVIFRPFFLDSGIPTAGIDRHDIRLKNSAKSG